VSVLRVRLRRFRGPCHIDQYSARFDPPIGIRADTPGGCRSGSLAHAAPTPPRLSRLLDVPHGEVPIVVVLSGDTTFVRLHGGTPGCERDLRPRGCTLRPMSVLPQMTYGLRMTPHVEPPRPFPSDSPPGSVARGVGTRRSFAGTMAPGGVVNSVCDCGVSSVGAAQEDSARAFPLASAPAPQGWGLGRSSSS
jgi:hypothetical protein